VRVDCRSEDTAVNQTTADVHHQISPAGNEPDPIKPNVVRARVIPVIALLMVIGLLGLLVYSLFAPDDARVGTGRVNASGVLVLENGREAPDFAIETFDGGDWRLSDQRGKIVVLNFWASWCPPCRDEMPLLTTADGNLGDGVVMVGVDVWDDDSDAREFLTAYNVSYPNGPDRDGIAVDYGLSGVPETFIIDAEGRIVAKLPGPVTSLEQLRGMVAEAR
jgi:cytochrome c biogenesis protein CcmG/thiol:disulfide interchange protein DsbE